MGYDLGHLLRSERVSSSTLGAPLFQPILPHHRPTLNSQVHNQQIKREMILPGLSGSTEVERRLPAKFIKWSRNDIIELRRSVLESRTVFPFRCLIYDISDISDQGGAQDAVQRGTMARDIGGIVVSDVSNSAERGAYSTIPDQEVTVELGKCRLNLRLI